VLDARRAAGFQLDLLQAALRLRISQPRLNHVLTGKIDKLSLDARVNLSAAARINVDIGFNGLPPKAVIKPC